MDDARTLTVGGVARLAGVSVRTLHHYDEIGLLRPSGRSDAGYRHYTNPDVERLQRILFYRALGFGLDQIAEALADPDADTITHLRRQHGLLAERIDHLRRLSDAVELAMEAHELEIPLTPEERLEIFGEHRQEDYEAEAQERWGDTEAYRVSRRRAAAYTKADWARIKAQGEAAMRALLEAMSKGLPPDSEAAMDAAEAHRAQIDDSFYPRSYEMHKGLAAMYLADPRFTATYERMATGTAQYLHDAIVANAARHGG
jgi:MerR family transcriptional regulator, thiopeptide resistance regulator